MTQQRLSTQVELQVAFYDVDQYAIGWHGNYPKYFEIARCDLLESIGYTYRDMQASNYFFPIIDLRIKYVKPVIFQQKIVVSATLVEWQHTLDIHYEITDQLSGERLTKGYTRQAAVRTPDQITQYECPAILQDKVAKALCKS